MLKAIMLVATFGFLFSCHAQDEYIGFNKFHVKQLLAKLKRDNLKTLGKETDSTIVFVVRDAEERDKVMIFYFDKNEICNKILQMFKVDSCYKTAFNDILAKNHLKWTKIMTGTYLSKYSKRLLLFENPKVPLCYILQHNKYMTKEQYNAFLPKTTEEPKLPPNQQ